MQGTKENSPSIKNIRVLVITLVFSVLFAFIFIKVVVLLDLKEYLTLVVPLLPVFYTIIYPILDRPFLSGKHNKEVENTSGPILIRTPAYFSNLSYWRILGAVGMVLLIKFIMELAQYAVVSYLSEGPTRAFWLQMEPLLLLKMLKGDLVVSHISILLVEMVLMSCFGGVWLGYTSKTRPIMEGLVAGTILSVVIAFTNLTPLYGKINEVASQWTGFLDSRLHFEILSGVIAFTFIFSCWVLAGLSLKAAHQKTKKTRKKSKPSK